MGEHLPNKRFHVYMWNRQQLNWVKQEVNG